MARIVLDVILMAIALNFLFKAKAPFERAIYFHAIIVYYVFYFSPEIGSITFTGGF
jgi:hypothetical protein